MPVLEINANIPIPNKKEAAIKASKLVASLLGKAENLMIVHIQDEQVITFAGTFEPAYTANIYSIGKISPEMNVNTSKGLSEFLSKELGLPDDRGYIGFHDMKASNMGWKGTVF